MLSWALTFLVIALIAAVLGFGGIAGSAAWIAQVLFRSLYCLVSCVVHLPRSAPEALTGWRRASFAGWE